MNFVVEDKSRETGGRRVDGERVERRSGRAAEGNLREMVLTDCEIQSDTSSNLNTQRSRVTWPSNKTTSQATSKM